MPSRGWSIGASPKRLLAAVGVLAAQELALDRAAVVLQSEWKDILNRSGSGKTYERGLAFVTKGGKVRPIQPSPEGRSSSHQASAPGEPPAKDSGALAQAVSIGRDGGKRRVGMGGRTGRIGLALEYGVNVPGSEVGPHPAENFRIEPRPHARPARDAAAEIMTEAARQVLRLGARDV